MGNYVLGQSQREYERLARQGQFIIPMTRRLYEDAGIKPGMRVLDLGSGAGDCCLLLAEMVGPTGSVIGVEMDPGAIEFAKSRVAAAGFRNVSFVQSEISAFADSAEGPADLDAIVGRCVLMYVRDPEAALGKIAKRLKPGGSVAFMEPMIGIPPGPDSPLKKVGLAIFESMRRSGVHNDLGMRLHKVFAGAGLPQPKMRFEAMLDPAEDTPVYQIVADTFLSMLPKAIEYGLIAPGEIDAAALPAKLAAMAKVSGYAAVYMMSGCAWCRTAIA
jgi:SAM-dependent methyltransferase